MSLIVVLLSIVLVLNAAFLMLLILIQLPKKEAGAGLAFGAGATDALFGAGSGNALTKMTKYAATFFLGLVLTLSILSQRVAHQGSSRIQSELKKRAASAAATAPAADASTANPPGTQVTTQGNQIIKITPVTTNSSIKVTPGTAPDAKTAAPAPVPATAPAGNAPTAPAKPAAQPQPAAPAK